MCGCSSYTAAQQHVLGFKVQRSCKENSFYVSLYMGKVVALAVQCMTLSRAQCDWSVCYVNLVWEKACVEGV